MKITELLTLFISGFSERLLRDSFKETSQVSSSSRGDEQSSRQESQIVNTDDTRTTEGEEGSRNDREACADDDRGSVRNTSRTGPRGSLTSDRGASSSDISVQSRQALSTCDIRTSRTDMTEDDGYDLPPKYNSQDANHQQNTEYFKSSQLDTELQTNSVDSDNLAINTAAQNDNSVRKSRREDNSVSRSERDETQASNENCSSGWLAQSCEDSVSRSLDSYNRVLVEKMLYVISLSVQHSKLLFSCS